MPDIRITGLSESSFKVLTEWAEKEKRTIAKQAEYLLERLLETHEKAEKGNSKNQADT